MNDAEAADAAAPNPVSKELAKTKAAKTARNGRTQPEDRVTIAAEVGRQSLALVTNVPTPCAAIDDECGRAISLAGRLLPNAC